MATDADTSAGTNASSGPTPLLSLSKGQLQRLRDHLDERLLSLERDERKDALGPLSSLVPRLTPILHLALQIPAREPWNSTRVAYLLTLTHTMVTYITSLPLVDIPKATRKRLSSEERELEFKRENEVAGQTIRCVLDLFEETERGWLAVLNRQGWVQGQSGVAVDVEGGAEVDMTSCVRLKSIVEIGREKILAWARPYGNFGGEAMGPDGDEGEVVPEEEKVGWEAEVVNVWKGILEKLHQMGVDG